MNARFPHFDFRMPPVRLGVGCLAEVPAAASRHGRRVVLVVGKRSFVESDAYPNLLEGLDREGVATATVTISGEPSPSMIDEAVSQHLAVDLVIGVGGGAVIDAGKAIAAMLPLEGAPVRDYLEGVGPEKHPGTTLPYLAVPTTAGTGAEASKNAVLSEVGSAGYKKSLRHDEFIPTTVFLDPKLTVSCPRSVTAACGLDALTQLLESFVSPKATPLTDTIAWSGLEAAAGTLVAACGKGANDLDVRGRMAYAAFCSGITLAHAGLGIVHGLAGPIGGFFEAPHGVVCGTLLASATRMNIDRLRRDRPASEALSKYARAGRLLSARSTLDDGTALDALIETLDRWTDELAIPTLDRYGLVEADAGRIVEESGLKQNPVELSKEDVREVLLSRVRGPEDSV